MIYNKEAAARRLDSPDYDSAYADPDVSSENQMISEVAHQKLEEARTLLSESSVQIVWFHSNLLFSHAAVAINDRLYGFFGGMQTPELPSLKGALRKIAELGPGQSMGNSDCIGITFQNIHVSKKQEEEIKGWYQRQSAPVLTCMHSASLALSAVDVKIPYRIILCPELSRVYLERTQPAILSKPCTVGRIPDNILLPERVCLLFISVISFAFFLSCYSKL